MIDQRFQVFTVNGWHSSHRTRNEAMQAAKEHHKAAAAYVHDRMAKPGAASMWKPDGLVMGSKPEADPKACEHCESYVRKFCATKALDSLQERKAQAVDAEMGLRKFQLVTESNEWHFEDRVNGMLAEGWALDEFRVNATSGDDGAVIYTGLMKRQDYSKGRHKAARLERDRLRREYREALVACKLRRTAE